MEIKLFTRTFLLVLVLFFGLQTVFFSETGVKKYWTIKNELVFQKNKIMKVENKIKRLQEDIEKFMADDFEAQKIARQDLQMGFENEKVYFLV